MSDDDDDIFETGDHYYHIENGKVVYTTVPTRARQVAPEIEDDGSPGPDYIREPISKWGLRKKKLKKIKVKYKKKKDKKKKDKKK
jgi:hypothetical protein